MSLAPVRAVIFDMDGVLTDSEPLINAAAIAMFAEKGLAVQAEDFHPFVGAGEDKYIGGVAQKYRLFFLFALVWTRGEVRSAKIRNYEPMPNHWMNRRLEDVWLAKK